MEPTNDEFAGIDFECPHCGTALNRYHERCPHCDHALDEEFCATYRSRPSVLVKVIAVVFLVGGVLIPLVLILGYLLF